MTPADAWQDISAALHGPGTFGCHEALHTARIISEMVAERLCEHPAIMLNAAWQRKAIEAANLLAELYQDIGAVHLSAPLPAPPSEGGGGG